MRWRSRLAEVRTVASGVDPGLVRLHLAGVAVASMGLAVAVMSVVRAVTGEPVTVVLISAVLAMISNLAVNEPSAPRLLATTALMAAPATVAVAAGTLLAPYRVVADVVCVAVMIGAVAVRRYGPRGTALGMAAVMGFFFTQFLQAAVAQLPSLLVAAVVGSPRRCCAGSSSSSTHNAPWKGCCGRSAPTSTPSSRRRERCWPPIRRTRASWRTATASRSRARPG